MNRCITGTGNGPVTSQSAQARKTRGNCNHRGTALIVAVVAFMASTAILFSVLRMVVNHQRQLQSQRQQMQAQYLAQAGIDRAIAQLKTSSEYRGEIWHVSVDELDGAATGEVTIRVEKIAENPNDLHVAVTADYPSDPIHRCQQSREATVHLK